MSTGQGDPSALSLVSPAWQLLRESLCICSIVCVCVLCEGVLASRGHSWHSTLPTFLFACWTTATACLPCPHRSPHQPACFRLSPMTSLTVACSSQQLDMQLSKQSSDSEMRSVGPLHRASWLALLADVDCAPLHSPANFLPEQLETFAAFPIRARLTLRQGRR